MLVDEPQDYIISLSLTDVMVFGTYFIQGGVGLGKEGGQAVLIATHLKMFCHDAVGHLQGQREGEIGSLLWGFPTVL